MSVSNSRNTSTTPNPGANHSSAISGSRSGTTARGAHTAAGARQKRKDIMAAHASITLSALTRAYLDDLRVRGYKPKTIAGYEAKLHRFTRWAESVGAPELRSFDAALVKQYITYLQHERRWATHPHAKVTPQPLISPVAIRNYVRDLKSTIRCRAMPCRAMPAIAKVVTGFGGNDRQCGHVSWWTRRRPRDRSPLVSYLRDGCECVANAKK